MREWNFTLLLNRAMIEADDNLFAHLQEFADGDVGYSTPADGRPTELQCDVEAATLLEAIADVCRRIRLIPELRAVGAKHDDVVTLGDAAQRCTRTRENLAQLAAGKRGPGGFPTPEWETPGTRFYSWAKIAAFLRDVMGDDIDGANRQIVWADQLLRISWEMEQSGVQVSADVLNAYGLSTAL